MHDPKPGKVRVKTSDRIVPTAIATVLSLLFAGAGQAYNRQWKKTLIFPVLAFLLWFLLLGWAVHLWAMVDAGVVGWLQTGSPGSPSVDGWRATGIKIALFVAINALWFGISAIWGPLWP